MNFTLSGSSTIQTTTVNTGGSILGGWAIFWRQPVCGEQCRRDTLGTISGSRRGAAGSFAAGGDVDATGTSNVVSGIINSLRFNSGLATSVDASNGLTITTGGILLIPQSSPHTIDNGTVTSGNGTDLIVTVGTSSTLKINSRIAGSIGLTKSGAGTLVVANPNNDFTGPVTLNSGSLQVLTAGALAANPITINGSSGVGAQLLISGGVTLNNPISINGPNAPVGRGSPRGARPGDA